MMPFVPTPRMSQKDTCFARDGPRYQVWNLATAPPIFSFVDVATFHFVSRPILAAFTGHFFKTAVNLVVGSADPDHHILARHRTFLYGQLKLVAL